MFSQFALMGSIIDNNNKNKSNGDDDNDNNNKRWKVNNFETK